MSRRGELRPLAHTLRRGQPAGEVAVFDRAGREEGQVRGEAGQSIAVGGGGGCVWVLRWWGEVGCRYADLGECVQDWVFVCERLVGMQTGEVGWRDCGPTV